MEFDQLRRREFITLLSGVSAWPVATRAQQGGNLPLITYLTGVSVPPNAYSDIFVQGLRDFNVIEGRDFRITYRGSGGYGNRLPALAEELIGLKPEVILATAVDSVVAVRNLTRTIPIVSPALADAVHLGLIASEARPGGNVTGIQPYIAGLPAKQMELAREVVPSTKKVGLLTNLHDPKAAPQLPELEAAGRALGVETVPSDANTPEEIEDALAMLASARVDVVAVLQSSMLIGNSRQIAASALAKRLPTVYGYRDHVVAGGLASYGVDLRWCFRRAAYFVEKILRGARPGDLPVEFPTKMFLVINLGTAKALGLKVPESFLLRADEVIE
jgi:putative tryptophan/tyrosine transport system substrate-binding protein